jgi:hypothetical protein
MAKNNKIRWWIGAILFAGFLLTFLMDVTGLALHQWLGIFVAILLLYHLLAHLDWVNAVADRFFGRTSNRSRLYLLINILIACGFAFIVGTGLLMSTWFQIPLVNYDFWRFSHILFSIGTLLMVVLKLMLHWRWIATTLRKARRARAALPTGPISAQTSSAASPIGRRQFLGVASVIGIGALVAAVNALQSLKLLQDSQDSVYAQDIPVPTRSPEASTTPESVVIPVEDATPTSEGMATVAPSTPTPAPTNCIVRCNFHCSYPGRCRKYVDLNQNNLCDNGECL